MKTVKPCSIAPTINCPPETKSPMKLNQPITSITRPVLLIGLAACILGGFTLKVFAPPPGAGKGKATAVKITILDASGDRIKSDGKGTYINGVDKVTSVIHDSGQLELETGYTSTKRRVSLDYSQLIFGTGCNRAGDPGIEIPDLNCDGLPNDPAISVAWARLFTLGLNLLNMVAGETRLGGFGIAFEDFCAAPTHVPWRIAFQNDGTEWVYSCGAACSAQVKVEAFDAVAGKGIAGTGVDKWIISAEAPAGSGAEACLWSGGTNTPVLREIVRMPFHLLVELQ